MAKSGFQPSGGTILTMPYFLPSSCIVLMYSMGPFLNSSSVGRKVGASCRPCGRDGLGSLGFGQLGCPRRSTVDRSKPGDFRALSGMGVDVDMGKGTAMDMPMRPRGAWENGLDEGPFGTSALETADGVAALEDGSVVASVAILDGR